jgi:hypothetical protein
MLRSTQFKQINDQHLGQIADSFSQTWPQGTSYNLEDVCDFVRRCLQRIDPVSFAWGHFTSIQNIVDHFLAATCPITLSSIHCPNNHPVNIDERPATSCQITILRRCQTIQAFINNQTVECASSCRTFHSHLIRKHVLTHPPPILAFDMSQYRTLLLESLVLTTINGQQTTYKLRGVIYYFQDHFTSCFITETGSVWYHDGLLTGQRMESEGNINVTDFTSCRSGVPTCAIYVTPSAPT